MAVILVFAHGPKSIASVFSVVWYHISNLKLNGEMVLKISRSQVGRTDGPTDGRKEGQTDGRTEGPRDGQTTGICMSYPINVTINVTQDNKCYTV